MKLCLEFTVKCSQCPAHDAFHALTLFPQAMEQQWEDAEVYFEALGWLKLPSGKWVCRKNRVRTGSGSARVPQKEAA